MSLVLESISFAYARVPALRDVAARAEAGTVTAVLGPNASGKSTLLRCIIGALRPQSGQALLDDRPVHRLRPRALAEWIAYVPQRSIVSAAFTVRQVVELGRFALPPDSRRINHALRSLDLEDVADRAYRALSVGQQQRVTLARALAQLAPDGLLVLDEPTSAMDLAHAAQAHRLLKAAANDGATVIMAMHDLSMAALVADRAWLLHDGRLVAAGDTGEVLEPPRLQQVFGVGFAWIADEQGRRRLLAEPPEMTAAAYNAAP